MVAIVDALGDAGIGVDLAAVPDYERLFPAFQTSNPDFVSIPSTEWLRWDIPDVVPAAPPAQVSLARRAVRRVRRLIRPQVCPPAKASVDAPLSVYSHIIGVDPVGIAAAARWSAIAGTRLIYISFELMLSDEVVGPYELRLKDAERKAAQKSDLVVIQDKERGRLLAEDNYLIKPNMCFVPVAPADASPPRTNYLRSKLGISAEKKIVLFQGTMAPWSGLNEWEDLVSVWPENVVLVIHSRTQLDARHAKFVARLTSSGRIFCTDSPVSSEELPILTASADVGLVCYNPSPDSWYHLKNLEAIGLASGKFAYFMMCGIPVLVNSRTSLAVTVESRGIGAVYQTASQSAMSLQSILQSWETKAWNARRYFETALDPSVAIESFVNSVKLLN